jgi:hypothetical protein
VRGSAAALLLVPGALNTLIQVLRFEMQARMR